MAKLTPREVAAVGRWWSQQTEPRVIGKAFEAAGFLESYSCIGWDELRRTLPDVAEVIGRSVIRRYGLRP